MLKIIQVLRLNHYLSEYVDFDTFKVRFSCCKGIVRQYLRVRNFLDLRLMMVQRMKRTILSGIHMHQKNIDESSTTFYDGNNSASFCNSQCKFLMLDDAIGAKLYFKCHMVVISGILSLLLIRT